MVLFFIGAVLAGLAVTVVSSRFAVDQFAILAASSRVPPFIIGITLVALGTDLPEIANSIVASFSGHGDLNVGDSVGSAVAQATLVLGLLPFFVGAFVVGRERVGRIGAATVLALGLAALLMRDGDLSRFDGAILILFWLVASLLLWRDLPASEPVMRVEYGQRTKHALIGFAALLGVAGGAAGAVWGLVNIAEILDVPEFFLAFFGTSIGTSLPEFAVSLTALRQGERDLAVGDVLGSSFLDSTISIGSGPLLFPTAVTASLVVQASLLAGLAIGFAVVALSWHRRHNRVIGALLLFIYLAFYLMLL